MFKDHQSFMFLIMLSIVYAPSFGQCGRSNPPDPVNICISDDDDSALCQMFPDFCPNKMKKTSDEDCQSSPIVIDMLNNGFSFSSPKGAIWFDLHGLGTFIYITWITAFQDNYFLVQDLNKNGQVDDGSELFGNGTRMLLHDNRLAPNGFVGLAQYDNPILGGNGDLHISSEDDIWERLYLWNDVNADGRSEKSELTPIHRSFLQSIYVIPSQSNRRDAYGNHLKYWSSFSTSNGTKVPAVDVFFVRLDE